VTHADLVIVGGGQSGLATAHVARTRGLRPIVLESGPEPVGSWPHYYDSLALFSPARFSSLPGYPFPGDPDRYPARDEVVEYLRDYAARLDVEIRTRTRVQQVIETGAGLLVTTAGGVTITADWVIAATGGFSQPVRPALPGLESFTGRVLHAADYRNGKEFDQQRLIVIGAGNSAIQIAVDAAEHARVSLATRAPITWAPQHILGKDGHWWLTHTGADNSRLLGRRLRGKTVAVIDDGRYQAAIATGNPDHRSIFTTIAGDQVTWADGTTDTLDAIVLATGYQPELSYLAGTIALDSTGKPLHHYGVSTTIPGLGYIGLPYQHSISSATLRGAGLDATRVLRRLRSNTGH
jgi:putative flavoprotein involved in K+ transport